MNTSNKHKFFSLVFVLLLISLICIIGFLTRQYIKAPYGYYDGEYICYKVNDEYWTQTSRDFVLSHEECHDHVAKDPKHFCTRSILK